MNILLRIGPRVARASWLPRWLRTGMVFATKKALTRRRGRLIEVDVPGVGRMALRPWDYVPSRLFFFGIWEPTISAAMRERLRPGSVAIDIGANIGYYSLLMSRAVGAAGQVFAAEPNPDFCDDLRRNVGLNHAANVTVLPYGISDRAEQRAFRVAQFNNTGASAFGEVVEDGLPLRSLAELVPAEALARTSVIKIDVEGMEAQVLRDLLPLLDTLPNHVAIFVELRVGEETRALLARLADAGFRALTLENAYELWRYTRPVAERPVAVDRIPDGQHDVLLIRTK